MGVYLWLEPASRQANPFDAALHEMAAGVLDEPSRGSGMERGVRLSIPIGAGNRCNQNINKRLPGSHP